MPAQQQAPDVSGNIKDYFMRIKALFFPIVIFIVILSCNNPQTNKEIIQNQDGSVLIPLNNIQIDSVDMTDEKGFKQGLWQEDDTINHRIKKEYNYKNGSLDGYYLEYKTASSDTLIFGHFSRGLKDGKWTYWATDKNKIDKIENYKRDILIDSSK